MNDNEFKKHMLTEEGRLYVFDLHFKKHYKAVAYKDEDLEQELFIKYLEDTRKHDFTTTKRTNFIKFYKVIAYYWKTQYHTSNTDIITKHYNKQAKKVLDTPVSERTAEDNCFLAKYTALKFITRLDTYDSVADERYSDYTEDCYIDNIDFKIYYETKLNKTEQKIISLRIEGYSISEISDKVNLPRVTVFRIIDKVTKAMKCE